MNLLMAAVKGYYCIAWEMFIPTVSVSKIICVCVNKPSDEFFHPAVTVDIVCNCLPVHSDSSRTVHKETHCVYWHNSAAI